LTVLQSKKELFRGYNESYNKEDSHEEEKEYNSYCPLCKLRKEEDFPHLYGECEALVDLRNSAWKELKGSLELIGAPITNFIKEYINSLDNTKRVHKAWFFMGLLHEEVAQKLAKLATKSKSNFGIA